MSDVNKEAHLEAKAVLEGFCSAHPEANPNLGNSELWQAKARALLEARQFAILQALSPETLQEIAEGRLNMAEIYQSARQEAQTGQKSKRKTSPGM
jgi:hypothetical protein